MVLDTSLRPTVRRRDVELKHLIALDAVATEGTFGKPRAASATPSRPARMVELAAEVATDLRQLPVSA